MSGNMREGPSYCDKIARKMRIAFFLRRSHASFGLIVRQKSLVVPSAFCEFALLQNSDTTRQLLQLISELLSHKVQKWENLRCFQRRFGTLLLHATCHQMFLKHLVLARSEITIGTRLPPSLTLLLARVTHLNCTPTHHFSLIH